MWDASSLVASLELAVRAPATINQSHGWINNNYSVKQTRGNKSKLTSKLRNALAFCISPHSRNISAPRNGAKKASFDSFFLHSSGRESLVYFTSILSFFSFFFKEIFDLIVFVVPFFLLPSLSPTSLSLSLSIYLSFSSIISFFFFCFIFGDMNLYLAGQEYSPLSRRYYFRFWRRMQCGPIFYVYFLISFKIVYIFLSLFLSLCFFLPLVSLAFLPSFLRSFVVDVFPSFQKRARWFWKIVIGDYVHISSIPVPNWLLAEESKGRDEVEANENTDGTVVHNPAPGFGFSSCCQSDPPVSNRREWGRI